ncbi:MAG TPA: hypothetical protein VKG24_19295 [Pseudolabrys sp.]|nr:hypothetical protein [Pseudolabrys sp.]
MSTPIRQAELSPDDPKFYAPPKWRNGEINAPPLQPFLRAPVFPSPPAVDGIAPQDEVSMDDAELEALERSHQLEYTRVRVTAIATAVGVVAWTAFCIAIGLERLDKVSFSQPRSEPVLASDSESSLNERLQAANIALQREWRPVIAPTLVVAESSGVVNAPLPLAIKVTNYTADTTINLSGLVPGTMLSSGTRGEEGQWRIAVDDLPQTHVIPPPEYVGPMTIVAELRSGDDQAIVRTPLKLSWQPAAAETTGLNEPAPPAPLPSVVENPPPKQALFEQFLAWRNESSSAPGASSAPPRRHKVAKKHRHKISPPALELQANAEPRWQPRQGTLTLSPSASLPRDQWPLWMGDRRTTTDWQDVDNCPTGSSTRGGKRSQSACR